MYATEKWIGSETYAVATRALTYILGEFEKPTYNQLLEVLDCMREISGDYCVFTDQK